MSRRKGWMFFALGLVLALSAAAMVFIVLQNAEAAAASGRAADTHHQAAGGRAPAGAGHENQLG